MDTIKAFVINGASFDVTVRKTNAETLFLATDIAKVLDIVNIRTSVTNMDANYKVFCDIATPAGTRNALFLTQDGLMWLLMKSHKDNAKPFQKWLIKVVKEIDNTGYYDVAEHQNDKEESQLQLELLKCQQDTDTRDHRMLIDNLMNQYRAIM